MSYVLGISAIDKESTLTLFKGSQLLYAVSEERITRVKQQGGFPYLAYEEMLNTTGITGEDIEVVAYPFLTPQNELLASKRYFSKTMKQIFSSNGLPLLNKLTSALLYPRSLQSGFKRLQNWENHLLEGLKKTGLGKKLRRYDHELCHAVSTFFASGYDQALILVSDNYGTGSSGGVFFGDNETVTPLVNFNWPNSLGVYYGRFTADLGFVPDRHEGKILGLAAYGDPSILYEEFLKDFKIFPDGSFEYYRFIDVSKFSKFREIVEHHKPCDIAAALQQVFETILLNGVSSHLKKTGLDRVCLAGGSICNVKLNQKIRELPGIREVFVFPGMGDLGTGYGAACLALNEQGISPRHQFENIYLSRPFEPSEIEAVVRNSGHDFEVLDDIELEIAKLLKDHKVVARWNGRMEFGPRALGNRSILCNPSDPAINKWLNDRLKRTEFMPFAPSVIEDLADENFFQGIDQAPASARYMTITFNVQPEMAKLIPAAVHVDGTARPQVVTEKLNPSFYKIIKYFYQLTGIPAIINTSFNVHEEPIVYGPEDALKAFTDGRLDYLAIDKFLLKARDNGPQEIDPTR